MRKITALLIATISVIVISGCSSRAGPFVTSISSDGRGGLIVEKCMAKFDPWMSTVNNDNCTSTTMHVQSN
ncbi:hypothetical protein LCGC14_0183470 [marine sediment metagenome]|uniref:Uncharacterized protein n=1 Tax=marine sediment metagenome TaxID=412755 RepID=A0A0F9UPF4_9ZZZZ